MKDISDPRLIKLKGALFIFTGLLASGMLIARAPDWRNAALLAIAIWSFCRFYYFAFYVIEHYIDPAFKFSGLGSFVKYLLQRQK